MKRGTIFLGIFAVIAAGIVGFSLFLQNQPPLEITVAVNPLVEPWVREAAADFNERDTLINGTLRARVSVTTISDLDVWRNSRQTFWTPENHPTGWIPASSASVTYASGANLPLTIVEPTLARTVIIWGGYSERVNVLTDDGAAALDWAEVVTAAETESWIALGGQSSWQFVNLAFPLADSTMSGLATLFSGAAAYSESPNLTNGAARDGDFYDWMEPVIDSVPNFNSIGGDIGVYAARGPNTVDIAIGPEVQWLNSLNAITRNGDVTFSYPEYAFVFDFSLAIWDTQTTTSDERAALQAFGDWLLEDAQQQAAVDLGLRPATGAPAAGARLFDAAAPYGILLDPPLDVVIQPPSSTDVQSLIQWFTTAQ